MSTAPPRPAKPTKEVFDTFNSSATGHQRADNVLSGSTSWRDSRQKKLHSQFNSGTGGGKRVSDTVGAGSLDFGKDGRTASGGWIQGASGLRKGGQKSIWESMPGARIDKDVERPAKRVKTEQPTPTNVVNPYTPFTKQDGSIRETSWTSHESSPSHLLSPIDPNSSASPTQPIPDPDNADIAQEVGEIPQLFANLAFYINGSTAPAVSDHKLKRLISERGGQVSVGLGRRTVTHVIIGRPNSNGGCGGGLSGSKLHKEVARKGGNALQYVTAEWVLESIREGKRLPESRFKGVNIAPKGVSSITSMFGQPSNTMKGSAPSDDKG
ncbi:hypothetical protein LTR37_018360 [Vermiconidia calcicola]|uniref:Uncharacterized protein n=1 Tax=Vermiconidia calcicola TaxID=1690605 RepID=A0ACC3MJ40_9PEZI|nr:hypothetical protein LTR37_018360 [Vermiconidia calcicola]